MSVSYNPQPLPPIDPNLDVTKNHYWSYHNFEALLSCKNPLTASKDEDLFIAVHQICELAFNQMITDMERVLEALAEALKDDANLVIGDSSEVCYFFKRILRLYEVVVITMPLMPIYFKKLLHLNSIPAMRNERLRSALSNESIILSCSS